MRASYRLNLEIVGHIVKSMTMNYLQYKIELTKILDSCKNLEFTAHAIHGDTMRITREMMQF